MSRAHYFLALSLFMAMCGCNQSQQSALEKKAEQAAEAVQNAAEKTAAQAVRDTSETATKTWTKNAKNLGQGGVALRVKSALALSTRLDGARIDVELQGSNIVLSGEVLTSKQKAVAHNLAQNIVDPKFQIVNRLKVVGPETAKSAGTIKAKGY